MLTSSFSPFLSMFPILLWTISINFSTRNFMTENSFSLDVWKNKSCSEKGVLTLTYTIPTLKGGYLDFSHFTELKNILVLLYIAEIYMKKQ